VPAVRPGQSDSARFCNGCGVKLETRCAACGQGNPPSSRFCNGCGQSLTPAPASERTPASYTPKHLAERILTSKAALEGERKHLAEIYGWFTEGFDTRDLREAKLLLDEVS
jgi:Double zinc ribbon